MMSEILSEESRPNYGMHLGSLTADHEYVSLLEHSFDG